MRMGIELAKFSDNNKLQTSTLCHNKNEVSTKSCFFSHSFIYCFIFSKGCINCQIYTKCYAGMEIPLKNALNRDKQVNRELQ